jgi:hypothetical protein
MTCFHVFTGRCRGRPVLLSYGLVGCTLHELAQARKVDSHAPTDPRRLEIAAADVAPQGRVRQTGVAFRLRVADPLLLYRLLQQLRPFLEVLDGAGDQATMCPMVAPQEDTSRIRARLAAQLKRDDVSDPIWEHLEKYGYVEEARDPDFPDAFEDLVRQARDLLKIERGAPNASKTPGRRSVARDKKATNRRRAEVAAEIRTKFAQAKADKKPNAPTNGDEKKPKTPTPEEWTQRTAHLPRLGCEGIRPPKWSIAESPITSKISNNRITVTAEPWVSPEDVRKRYESLRDIWPWKQTPSERRVELVGFVLSFCGADYDEEHDVFALTRGPHWPGWRGIMERWNQLYPLGHDWHYTNSRNLLRDFRAASGTLMRYEDY